MRSAAFLLLVLFVAACSTNLAVPYEGLRCDDPHPCPEGYACVAQVCRACPEAGCEALDRCGLVTCDAPPAPTCVDSHTLRTFDEGRCGMDGACSYPPAEVLCALGCEEGACKEDPCASKSCDSPPAPTCVDADTLRVFASLGTCDRGGSGCVYAPTEVDCKIGCEAGRCTNQDLCIGRVCATPPAPRCAGDTVRSYSAPGACDAGTGLCTYPFEAKACARGCAEGACRPPPLSFEQRGPALRSHVTAVDQAPHASGAHILVVGPGGFVARWNGAEWTTLPSGTTEDLSAVWLASPSVGYVTGNAGTLLRYDGSGLSPVSGGPSFGVVNVVAVHGRAADAVLVAAADGSIARYDGVSWTQTSLGQAFAPRAVFVSSQGDFRVAGSCGAPGSVRPCVAHAESGHAAFFVEADTAIDSAEVFHSAGPSPLAKSVVLLGASALVRAHSTHLGFSFPGATPSLVGSPVVGIAPGSSDSNVFILTGHAGRGGQLYRFSPTSIPALADTLLRVYGRSPSMSRTYSGGVIVADGMGASANVFRRGAVTLDVMEVGEDWEAVAQTPAGGWVLLSRHGDLATRAGALYEFSRPAEDGAYLGVVAGDGFALAVGEGGRALRWGLKSLPASTLVATGTTASLRAVCRVSDSELYAVGDGGAALRYDGATFTPMSTGTTRDLHAVTCLGPGAAVAAGEGGLVWRLSGGSWGPLGAQLPSTATLSSVAVSGESLYVAGGGVFARLRAGQWSLLPALPALRALHVRAPSDLYAVNGSRVVRFDGVSWSTTFTSPQVLRGVGGPVGAPVFVGLGGVVVAGK